VLLAPMRLTCSTPDVITQTLVLATTSARLCAVLDSSGDMCYGAGSHRESSTQGGVHFKGNPSIYSLPSPS